MPPYELSGRHRDPRARRLPRRPRHPQPPSAPPAGRNWLRRAVLVALAVTVVIDVTLIVLHELQSRANEARAAQALFIPAPSTTAAPSPRPTLLRAQPRATRRPTRTATTSATVRRTPTRSAPASTSPPSRSPSPRPSQLLGPNNLGRAVAGYCRSAGGRGTAAALTRDGWFCVRMFDDARPVDMDAVCRDLYGPAAWARQLDASDQWSWRCYRYTP
ncbi:hypothetical protein [Krasilnikovia sp. MM14-A1004]|uniref:hypothetical protein n=1 Tax=Krasilnikovia sp. MM14-A1004 TaxID=3373541 RepID=UPI00399CEAE4